MTAITKIHQNLIICQSHIPRPQKSSKIVHNFCLDILWQSQTHKQANSENTATATASLGVVTKSVRSFIGELQQFLTILFYVKLKASVGRNSLGSRGLCTFEAGTLPQLAVSVHTHT